MNDQQVLHHYERMKEIYKELPHPDTEPKQFAYFVKLYLYYHVQNN